MATDAPTSVSLILNPDGSCMALKGQTPLRIKKGSVLRVSAHGGCILKRGQVEMSLPFEPERWRRRQEAEIFIDVALRRRPAYESLAAEKIAHSLFPRLAAHSTVRHSHARGTQVIFSPAQGATIIFPSGTCVEVDPQYAVFMDKQGHVRICNRQPTDPLFGK